MLGPAVFGIRHEADGQDEIDQLHFWHLLSVAADWLGWPWVSFAALGFLQVPEQKTDGKRLRVRPLEVNNVDGAIR
jgi:hypothetical protein